MTLAPVRWADLQVQDDEGDGALHGALAARAEAAASRSVGQALPAWLDARFLREASARELLEALIFDKAKHPRWPKGTPGGKGGQFMQVGEWFRLGGSDWEIEHIMGGKVIAHRADGKYATVETQVFDVKEVGGVPTLPKAEVAPPRPIKGGKHGSDVPIIDPYVDPSTHDPSIQIPAGSEITPEQWLRFGKIDQEFYVELMGKFGAYGPGKAKALLDKSYDAYDTEVQKLVKSAYHAQYGSSSGFTLSLTSKFGSLAAKLTGKPDPALVKVWETREKARMLQAEHRALIAWDLYNRTLSPDLACFHKDHDHKAAWWTSNMIQGTTPVFSGLSQSFSWRPNFFGSTTLATNIAIRHILMSSASAQPVPGSVSFPHELEVSVSEQLKVDGRSVAFDLADLTPSQKEWLENSTNAPRGGEIIDLLRNAMQNGAPLPIPPAPPNIVMDSQSKTWADPPPAALDVVGKGAAIDPKDLPSIKSSAIPPADLSKKLPWSSKTDDGTPQAHPAMDEGLGLKAGDFMMGLKGTLYWVGPDPGNSFGLRYHKIVIGSDGKPNFTGESWAFENGGKNKYFRLSVNVPPAVVKETEGETFVPEKYVIATEEKFVGELEPGTAVKVHGHPYEITGKLSNAWVKVKSLETGQAGKLNTDFKTLYLVPKPDWSPEPEHAPLEPGVWFFLPKGGPKAGLWEITSVLKDGTLRAKPRAGGKVQKFNPKELEENDDLITFDPAAWTVGEAVKGYDLAERVGQFIQVGKGAKPKPAQIVSVEGKKVRWLDLTTGKEQEASVFRSFHLLHPEAAPGNEPGGGVAGEGWEPDAWEPDPAVKGDLAAVAAAGEGTTFQVGEKVYKALEVTSAPDSGKLVVRAEQIAGPGAGGAWVPLSGDLEVQGLRSKADVGELKAQAILSTHEVGKEKPITTFKKGDLFVSPTGIPYRVSKTPGGQKHVQAVNLATGKPYPVLATKSMRPLKPKDVEAAVAHPLQGLAVGDRFTVPGQGSSVYELVGHPEGDEGLALVAEVGPLGLTGTPFEAFSPGDEVQVWAKAGEDVAYTLPGVESLPVVEDLMSGGTGEVKLADLPVGGEFLDIFSGAYRKLGVETGDDGVAWQVLAEETDGVGYRLVRAKPDQPVVADTAMTGWAEDAAWPVQVPVALTGHAHAIQPGDHVVGPDYPARVVSVKADGTLIVADEEGYTELDPLDVTVTKALGVRVGDKVKTPIGEREVLAIKAQAYPPEVVVLTDTGAQAFPLGVVRANPQLSFAPNGSGVTLADLRSGDRAVTPLGDFTVLGHEVTPGGVVVRGRLTAKYGKPAEMVTLQGSVKPSLISPTLSVETTVLPNAPSWAKPGAKVLPHAAPEGNVLRILSVHGGDVWVERADKKGPQFMVPAGALMPIGQVPVPAGPVEVVTPDLPDTPTAQAILDLEKAKGEVEAFEGWDALPAWPGLLAQVAALQVGQSMMIGGDNVEVARTPEGYSVTSKDGTVQSTGTFGGIPSAALVYAMAAALPKEDWEDKGEPGVPKSPELTAIRKALKAAKVGEPVELGNGVSITLTPDGMWEAAWPGASVSFVLRNHAIRAGMWAWVAREDNLSEMLAKHDGPLFAPPYSQVTITKDDAGYKTWHVKLGAFSQKFATAPDAAANMKKAAWDALDELPLDKDENHGLVSDPSELDFDGAPKAGDAFVRGGLLTVPGVEAGASDSGPAYAIAGLEALKKKHHPSLAPMTAAELHPGTLVVGALPDDNPNPPVLMWDGEKLWVVRKGLDGTGKPSVTEPGTAVFENTPMVLDSMALYPLVPDADTGLAPGWEIVDTDPKSAGSVAEVLFDANMPVPTDGLSYADLGVNEVVYDTSGEPWLIVGFTEGKVRLLNKLGEEENFPADFIPAQRGGRTLSSLSEEHLALAKAGVTGWASIPNKGWMSARLEIDRLDPNSWEATTTDAYGVTSTWTVGPGQVAVGTKSLKVRSRLAAKDLQFGMRAKWGSVEGVIVGYSGQGVLLKPDGGDSLNVPVDALTADVHPVGPTIGDYTLSAWAGSIEDGDTVRLNDGTLARRDMGMDYQVADESGSIAFRVVASPDPAKIGKARGLLATQEVWTPDPGEGWVPDDVPVLAPPTTWADPPDTLPHQPGSHVVLAGENPMVASNWHKVVGVVPGTSILVLDKDGEQFTAPSDGWEPAQWPMPVTSPWQQAPVEVLKAGQTFRLPDDDPPGEFVFDGEHPPGSIDWLAHKEDTGESIVVAPGEPVLARFTSPEQWQHVDAKHLKQGAWVATSPGGALYRVDVKDAADGAKLVNDAGQEVAYLPAEAEAWTVDPLLPGFDAYGNPDPSLLPTSQWGDFSSPPSGGDWVWVKLGFPEFPEGTVKPGYVVGAEPGGSAGDEMWDVEIPGLTADDGGPMVSAVPIDGLRPMSAEDAHAFENDAVPVGVNDEVPGVAYKLASGTEWMPVDVNPDMPMLEAYKSVWGSGGKYKHVPVSEVPLGAIFHGKDGARWVLVDNKGSVVTFALVPKGASAADYAVKPPPKDKRVTLSADVAKKLRVRVVDTP